jgi:hypothetical protein
MTASADDRRARALVDKSLVELDDEDTARYRSPK